MTRCTVLFALLLAACDPPSPQPSDAGTETCTPCLVDEDCADLGPYGYCRTWVPGEPGLCVLD